MDYRDYIKSPEWKGRSRMYRDAHPRCEICGCALRSRLDVYHVRRNNLGSEPDGDLITLCKSCHREVERLKQYGEEIPTYSLMQFIVDIPSGGHPNLTRAMGNLARILPPLIYKYNHLYSYVKGEERKYCDMLHNACKRYADTEEIIKDPEILIPFRAEAFSDNDFFLGVFVRRALNGINGKDDRITYQSDSGDCFDNALHLCVEMHNLGMRDMFDTVCFICALCIDIAESLSSKFPNLCHNARLIAWKTAGQLWWLFEEEREIAFEYKNPQDTDSNLPF